VNDCKFDVADCIADYIRFAIPQPSEWQRIGNQIESAPVVSWPDFVGMHYTIVCSPIGSTKILVGSTLKVG
jgi:hypothetical protein